ncbi:hypothetical protein JCM6882_004315 [Rhodosporidiobolus microsporus]
MPVRSLPVEVTRRILHEAIWAEPVPIDKRQVFCDTLWLVCKTWHAIVAELRRRTVALPLFDLQHIERTSRFFPPVERIKDVRHLKILNAPLGGGFFYNSIAFDPLVDDVVELLEQPGWRLRSLYFSHICISYGPDLTIAEALPAFLRQPSLASTLTRVHLTWHAASDSFLPLFSSLPALSALSSLELCFEQDSELDLDKDELEAYKPGLMCDKLRDVTLTATYDDLPNLAQAIVRTISPAAPLERFNADRVAYPGLFATLCAYPTLEHLELDVVLHSIGYGEILPSISSVPSSLIFFRLVLASVRPPPNLDVDPPPLSSILSLIPRQLHEFQLYFAALSCDDNTFTNWRDVKFPRTADYVSSTLAFFPTTNCEQDGRIFRKWWNFDTGEPTVWCLGPTKPGEWDSDEESEAEGDE